MTLVGAFSLQSKRVILPITAGKGYISKMDRPKITDELRRQYSGFVALVERMTEAEFTFTLNGEKWSAGQQADHLYRSLAPLNKGLATPQFVLKSMFGKSDHPSASYDELVARYRDALVRGGAA